MTNSDRAWLGLCLYVREFGCAASAKGLFEYPGLMGGMGLKQTKRALRRLVREGLATRLYRPGLVFHQPVLNHPAFLRVVKGRDRLVAQRGPA